MRSGTYFATERSRAGACDAAKLACMFTAGRVAVAAAIGAAAGAVVLGDSVLATCVPDGSEDGRAAFSDAAAGSAESCATLVALSERADSEAAEAGADAVSAGG